MGGDSRVYLSLPYVSKEKFSELLQELKQNGAKFDKEHKKWYADKESVDSGIFNPYIRTGKEEFDLTRERLKQDGRDCKRQ